MAEMKADNTLKNSMYAQTVLDIKIFNGKFSRKELRYGTI